jgi:hypothetical protein
VTRLKTGSQMNTRGNAGKNVIREWQASNLLKDVKAVSFNDDFYPLDLFEDGLVSDDNVVEGL